MIMRSGYEMSVPEWRHRFPPSARGSFRAWSEQRARNDKSNQFRLSSFQDHTNLSSLVAGRSHQNFAVLKVESLPNFAGQIVGARFILDDGENRGSPGALAGAGNPLTSNELNDFRDARVMDAALNFCEGLTRQMVQITKPFAKAFEVTFP